MAELPPEIPDERRHLPRSPSSDFTFKRFGRQTFLQRSILTIGTSAVRILSNNPNRLFYMIMNKASVNVELDWVQDFTFGSSLLLVANGGFLQQSIEDDGDVVAWELFGAAAFAGSGLFIMEIIGT